VDGTVIDQVTTIETNEQGPRPPQGAETFFDDELIDDDFDDFATGTVPQTRPVRTEAEAFREGLPLITSNAWSPFCLL
jgi:hypothetical protein